MKQYIRISLEITHLCDNYCDKCSHRIRTSNYKYLTDSDYELILKALKEQPVSEIELIGGEPLVHPHIEELVANLRRDFPKARLLLITNGKKLLKFPLEFRKSFSRIYISWYEGINDEIIKEVIKEKNIFVNKTVFMDIDLPEKLSLEDARKAYYLCNNTRIRFLGSKIYYCCLAEGIEREYGVDNLHIKIGSFSDNWVKKTRELPTYEACRYCFNTPVLINRNNRIAKLFSNFKKYIVYNSILAQWDFPVLWKVKRYYINKSNWYKFHPERHNS